MTNLVQIRFGARQDDGERQIENEGRETDDTQTEETTPTGSRSFRHFGVVDDTVATGECLRRFFLAVG